MVQSSIDRSRMLPLALVLVAAYGFAGALAGRSLSAEPTQLFPPTLLWGGEPGTFANVAPFALGTAKLQQLYGKSARARAKTWVEQGKALWCGTKSKPDSEPAAGVFPSAVPPTSTTNWPGACPGNARAQELFDMGLVWRMMFNDNEATCAFRAATRADPTCAMAPLGAALSMGPNVNYAFITSPGVYDLIMQSLNASRYALSSNSIQLPLAPIIHTALLQRYCVDGVGQLDWALANPVAAFNLYSDPSTQLFAKCSNVFTQSAVGLAQAYPEDVNVAAIAAGALMEQPAWMWWQVGSIIAGSVTSFDGLNVSNTSAPSTLKIANSTALGQLSYYVKPLNAIANLILQRGMEVAPDHLGLLHYAIHSMEANPQPGFAQWVGDRLYDLGGKSQGHAAHMRTHIDMRVGDYSKAIEGNRQAVKDDADWTLARSGGGIMSVLYKYVPHNVAFVTEAAQHAGSWEVMSSAIALLNYVAGFPLVSDPSMLSLVQHLMRQLLLPLRFGRYTLIEEGTRTWSGPGPVKGLGANASIRILLPNGGDYNVTCGQACSNSRLVARTIALARLGKPVEAEVELGVMVALVCASDPDAMKADPEQACSVDAIKNPVGAAADLGLYYLNKHLETVKSGTSNTLSLNSSQASGTLTIDNGAANSGLNLLVPAAEVLAAQGKVDIAILLLREAVFLQDNSFYDEPAPFFYPVGETLAGVLLKRGETADIVEASAVLRRVLFQWPRSALAATGLDECMKKGPDPLMASTGAYELIRASTTMNDTAMDLAWL